MVICPECEKEGKKSTIRISQFGTSTCLAWSPYYDEDGKYHSQDPNSGGVPWQCSNGHEGFKAYEKSCWCGWPNNPKGE